MKRHVDDEQLEQYSMGNLSEEELTELEEHLLLCGECQERLTEIDAYTQAMRSASTALRSRGTARAYESKTQALFRKLTVPKLAWASAVAAAVIAVTITGGRRDSAGPVAVFLTATRGAELPAAVAPPNTPLTLTLDLTDIPASPRYLVDVVDSTGRQIVRSEAARQGNRLLISTPKLPVGLYFVRLYSSGDLLREYGLRIDQSGAHERSLEDPSL